MELAEFAAEYAGSEPGIILTEFSGAGRRLAAGIGASPESASALIATMFWRAWLASDIAPAFLGPHSPQPGAVARSRTIIVPRPRLSRFDLVILDPAIAPGRSPQSMSAVLPGEMRDILMSGAARATVETPIAAIGSDAVALAIDAVANPQQPWRFVIAPEPQQERLSVPSVARSVDDGAGQVSTAGVCVEDATKPGRLGVTAALHGVDNATALTVDGQPGTIIRTDSITDSAFIEVALGHVPTMTVNGALSGMAPRGNQNADFRGSTSGHTSTVISGWDAQVPNPSARRQACVYTRRDAQGGDSGSALVTDDNWIAGFAFERSKIGEVPAQCAWIWAESVLNRLQVKLA
ncbi:MAG TPA: hypothetical protein VHS58_09380 [Acetobacteraceae bacterium]|jgi:hypothetical protein|nr:hypothetical protein [Acetobacteraceae bacterium]